VGKITWYRPLLKGLDHQLKNMKTKQSDQGTPRYNMTIIRSVHETPIKKV
jgi:hypothetical protein